MFISVDVETAGPIAGIHSLLSLGAVAMTLERGEFGGFFQNLLPLDGQTPDPDTSEWWKKQSTEALESLRDPPPRPARNVVEFFVEWALACREDNNLVFAAWPAAFDLPFVAYYCFSQAGAKLVRRTVCIKTLAQAVLGFPFDESGKLSIPRDWHKTEHRHTALGDAREQGEILMRALREAERMRNLGPGRRR